MPKLQHLDLSWSQHPECHKLLKAAGPSVAHLNLRVQLLICRGHPDHQGGSIHELCLVLALKLPRSGPTPGSQAHCVGRGPGEV